MGGIAAITGVVTYLSYQCDIRTARKQVMSGSQVIETKCRPIEYATMGEGPPVLVVHEQEMGSIRASLLHENLSDFQNLYIGNN